MTDKIGNSSLHFWIINGFHIKLAKGWQSFASCIAISNTQKQLKSDLISFSLNYPYNIEYRMHCNLFYGNLF